MLPYINSSVIHFDEGMVNIDQCSVRDLKKLFGAPIIVYGQGNKNELAFRWRSGVIRAFPLPEEELSDHTQIHLLHFVLATEVPLKELILQYRCQPAFYFVEAENEKEYFAIFNLRLQVKFYPATNLAKVLGFVNKKHVLTCLCQECTLIRQEVKNVKSLQGIELLH